MKCKKKTILYRTPTSEYILSCKGPVEKHKNKPEKNNCCYVSRAFQDRWGTPSSTRHRGVGGLVGWDY